jgi:hypothetical protein
MCKCSWRLSEASVGSSWVANIAVSSANVPDVVSLEQSCTVHSDFHYVMKFVLEHCVRRSTILLLGFSEIKFNGFICVWKYNKIFTYIDNDL